MSEMMNESGAPAIEWSYGGRVMYQQQSEPRHG